MSHYRIIEWSRYQHYKDRDPPWIKLHRDLLTSQTWVMLTDASRVLAVACMLVAAGTDNKIPTNPEFMKRRAYLNKVDFAPLVEVGFVELVNDNNTVSDASKTEQTLAFGTECSSETEKRQSREEAEAEQGARAPDAQETDDDKPTRLPADWQPSDACRDHASDKGLDPASTAEAFTDYFTQGRGKKEQRTRSGWERRWRVWCNTDAERKPSPRVGVRPSSTGGDAGAFARAAARLGRD